MIKKQEKTILLLLLQALSILGVGIIFTSMPNDPIVGLSCELTVPPIPNATHSTLFVWPGLQPQGRCYYPINNGVLQPVLTYGPSCARYQPPLGQWWISGQYVNTFLNCSHIPRQFDKACSHFYSNSECNNVGNYLAVKPGDTLGLSIAFESSCAKSETPSNLSASHLLNDWSNAVNGEWVQRIQVLDNKVQRIQALDRVQVLGKRVQEYRFNLNYCASSNDINAAVSRAQQVQNRAVFAVETYNYTGAWFQDFRDIVLIVDTKLSNCKLALHAMIDNVDNSSGFAGCAPFESVRIGNLLHCRISQCWIYKHSD